MIYPEAAPRRPRVRGHRRAEQAPPLGGRAEAAQRAFEDASIELGLAVASMGARQSRCVVRAGEDRERRRTRHLRARWRGARPRPPARCRAPDGP